MVHAIRTEIPRTLYVVHTTFLANRKNSFAIEIQTTLYVVHTTFLANQKNSFAIEIQTTLYVVRGTYDFLGKPEKFICTYDILFL